MQTAVLKIACPETPTCRDDPPASSSIPFLRSLNLETSELPQAGGASTPKPDMATSGATAMREVTLEAESETLMTDIKFLSIEMTKTAQTIDVALAATLREHAELLDSLARQEQSTHLFERGPSGVAQAVLTAQNRTKKPPGP
jgi:hypothetical protein